VFTIALLRSKKARYWIKAGHSGPPKGGRLTMNSALASKPVLEDICADKSRGIGQSWAQSHLKKGRIED